MAAGMKDVASLAGAAVGTVSNVLNHPELVRPQTRARVEAAMEQLGFIPNASARQLRAGRGSCLGLVVLDVRNPFFTEVARGVGDCAQAQGYAVILCNSDEAEDKERHYLRVLEGQRVRGILITPVHGSAPAIKGIRDRGTPVVLLARPGPPGHCSVAVDDRRGAYHAVIRAGLDPAAVLTEIPVPAMNTNCGAQAADEIRAAGPYGPARPRPRSAPTTCWPWACSAA
jgi:LacI family transcriptional regulator